MNYIDGALAKPLTAEDFFFFSDFQNCNKVLLLEIEMDGEFVKQGTSCFVIVLCFLSRAIVLFFLWLCSLVFWLPGECHQRE